MGAKAEQLLSQSFASSLVNIRAFLGNSVFVFIIIVRFEIIRVIG